MTDDRSPDHAAWGGLALLSLLILGYSVVVAGQLLLGVLVVCLLLAVPLWWKLTRRFLTFVDAVEEIADALQRLAAVREAERDD